MGENQPTRYYGAFQYIPVFNSKPAISVSREPGLNMFTEWGCDMAPHIAVVRSMNTLSIYDAAFFYDILEIKFIWLQINRCSKKRIVISSKQIHTR
eukprot:scaffold2859_cov101-Cylindrotheca_fusiformis.AAC.4